jgi:hypothetical protein
MIFYCKKIDSSYQVLKEHFVLHWITNGLIHSFIHSFHHSHTCFIQACKLLDVSKHEISYTVRHIIVPVVTS